MISTVEKVHAMLKPLFIPLKREWFAAFKAGTKRVEYRPYGPRWNERTCWEGRPVVLSLGYGKGHRLTGKVAKFAPSTAPSFSPAWVACYGSGERIVACIEITLDHRWEQGDRITGLGWLTGTRYTGPVEAFHEGAPGVRSESGKLVWLEPETITAAE